MYNLRANTHRKGPFKGQKGGDFNDAVAISSGSSDSAG